MNFLSISVLKFSYGCCWPGDNQHDSVFADTVWDYSRHHSRISFRLRSGNSVTVVVDLEITNTILCFRIPYGTTPTSDHSLVNTNKWITHLLITPKPLTLPTIFLVYECRSDVGLTRPRMFSRTFFAQEYALLHLPPSDVASGTRYSDVLNHLVEQNCHDLVSQQRIPLQLF